MRKRVDQESRFKRELFWWAIGVGKEASNYRFNRKPMPWSLRPKFLLANSLVFRKVKEQFGGRLRFMVSGAAPIAKEILEFFPGLDPMVLESWGMTETEARCI